VPTIVPEEVEYRQIHFYYSSSHLGLRQCRRTGPALMTDISYLWAYRMLPGLNAAAVGLVVTAVFQLTFKLRQTSPFPDATICIGIVGFVLADVLKLPAPIAIVVGGVLGVLAWATGMH
jgi:chromate transport protein ChrA